MLRKTVLLILLVSILIMPAAAAAFRHSISYNLFVPEFSHILDYRFDCLNSDDKGFSFGVTASAGYGINHFTQFGSNALVYGPELSLGALFQYGFNSGVKVDASIGAIAAYPLYPQVVRGLFSLDVLFPVGTGSFIGVGAGFTFPQWEALGRVFWGVSR